MNTSFRRGTISLAACGLLVLVQTSPAIASVGQDPLNLGPGTHVFDLSGDSLTPLFTDATYVQIQGTRNNDGGCSFPSSLTRAPGEAAKGEVTAAINESRCLATMRSGHLSKAPRHGTKKLALVAQPAGDPCHYGADDIWQEDPLNIVVNDTTTLIDACYDYSKIISCSGNDDYSWYTPTHWYPISGPSNGSFESPALVNCYAWTYFYVGNDWFRCPQQAHTRTLYADNEEGVNYNGYFWDNSYYTTSGTCSYLLRWHHTLY